MSKFEINELIELLKIIKKNDYEIFKLLKHNLDYINFLEHK
ncbi:hypothetical protein [Clostridium sp. ZS2]|nr:hypothetical protein [Clostridium sp. ZS2]